jgi:hypothetical protein
MYLVKGLRSECHSITDTWGVHSLRMDAIKRDLRQKGMRIESRAQSHTGEPQRLRLLQRLMMTQPLNN